MSVLFHQELQLPSRGRSQRITIREVVGTGEQIPIFDSNEKGCILHWWITFGSDTTTIDRDAVHDFLLSFYYDGQSQPTFQITLARFFGILLNQDTYMMESAAIQIMPRNGFNFYLPIPFEALKVELAYQGPGKITVYSMMDWQQYDDDTAITPLRLETIAQDAHPAEIDGSVVMADLTGEGFIAGLVNGVTMKKDWDSWFHNGGDLWLLDGESYPHALRGIGGEDLFGMSFGIHHSQGPWLGAPLHTSDIRPNEPGYQGIMYRFFGPDPVWFNRSAVLRFGSRHYDFESVVYAYVRRKASGDELYPPKWKIAGPFACKSESDFHKQEWAECDIDLWPSEWTADFGVYVDDNRSMVSRFRQAVTEDAEHGWCDFARHFRGKQRTNPGTLGVDASGYALGELTVAAAGDYNVQVGFDDRFSLWLNGKKIHSGNHDRGFQIISIPVALQAGTHNVLVKLSNSNSLQWRLWAFSLTVTKKDV
jgi:hypothetical protein